jgi:citrate lyase subunit beta / citryl-CoA lyase
MSQKSTTIAARSWLFAPGDSARKMEKATAGPADIVLLDLEDAVTGDQKPLARQMVCDFLKGNPENLHRLWVRINPLDTPYALADLAAIMQYKPGGILLPKVYGRPDVDALDKYLSVLEVANGIELGATRVIATVTETAAAMFTTGDYAGAPRLCGMTWGAEDLADALEASENVNPDGSYGFTYELARTMTLMGAHAAGVTPVETIMGDFKDLETLRIRAEKCRRAGFRGMMAIHPAQVDVINEAFTPNEEEIARAQEIVDVFAANPGVGAIGFKGGMLDRPYLARAEMLLRLAGRL